MYYLATLILENVQQYRLYGYTPRGYNYIFHGGASCRVELGRPIVEYTARLGTSV